MTRMARRERGVPMSLPLSTLTQLMAQDAATWSTPYENVLPWITNGGPVIYML